MDINSLEEVELLELLDKLVVRLCEIRQSTTEESDVDKSYDEGLCDVEVLPSNYKKSWLSTVDGPVDLKRMKYKN